MKASLKMDSKKKSDQKSSYFDLSSSEKPSSTKVRTDNYSTRTGSLSHVRGRPPPGKSN